MAEEQDSNWEKIATKLHGELSIEEEAELRTHSNDLIQSPEFKKAQHIYCQLTEFKFIDTAKKDRSWKKIEAGIKSDKFRWLKVSLKYAAIVVIAFVAGNSLKLFTPEVQEISYCEIRAPYSQMSKVFLSDGTKIWLNSGTTLRFPDRFSEKARNVYINGEAYFEVTKMAHKPFIVNTIDLKVEVLGTSFNISAYKEDKLTAVTLVEGSVSIQNLEGIKIGQLKPGELATKFKDKNTLEIRTVETSFYKAWTEGKIYFDDQPLDQIAVKLERWFNVDILFATEHLKSYRFTGTILKNKPVDQIMQALELLAPIRFKHQVNATGKDKITIYKRA